MQETVFISMPIVDFQGAIIDAVNACFKTNKENPKVGEIVNGKTLCQILGISEPTLIRWREAGKIPFIEIGGAYRYEVNTVINALTVNKK